MEEGEEKEEGMDRFTRSPSSESELPQKVFPMLTLKNAKGGEEEEEEGLFKADTVRRRRCSKLT